MSERGAGGERIAGHFEDALRGAPRGRIHEGDPFSLSPVSERGGEERRASSDALRDALGGIAPLGERLVCNQKVTGSSPVTSTSGLTLNANRDTVENVEILRKQYRSLTIEYCEQLSVNRSSI